MKRKEMLVNEIFYSLQGEGLNMGRASIFIRLSKCNLSCSFCDTEYESGTEMSLEELRDHIAQWPCRRIIWTGGEPTLQLTEEVVAYFKALGYHQSIETNGTRRPPHGLDYITCSPKKEAMRLLHRNFPDGVGEFRFPIGQDIDSPEHRGASTSRSLPPQPHLRRGGPERSRSHRRSALCKLYTPAS